MFWILVNSTDDQRFQIDFSSEEGQEYQAVRIIGKDTAKSASHFSVRLFAALCPSIQVISETEKNYVIWQNRAFRFYLAARLLYQKEQYSPAAFCAIQALEALMKATLVYWDKSFNPTSTNHKVAGMIRSIKNKANDGSSFTCPDYFYRDKRFQSVTRYPANGKGIGIPWSFRDDLDAVFCRLIMLVPFQFNTELKRALSGKKRMDLNILRYRNREMRSLRAFLNVRLVK